MTPVFSADLTDRERSLGFELAEVSNPAAAPGGDPFTPVKVPAVFLRLGRFDRIIKLSPFPGAPAGGYQHQRYGTWGAAGSPGWKPVGPVAPTPGPPLTGWENAAGDEGSLPAIRVTARDPGDAY